MKKKYTYLLIGLFALMASSVFGQTGVGTTSPTKNVDVNGDMRVRNLSSATQTSTDQVLTADANGNVRQLSGYKNTAIGDIKYSMQKTDHAGWYLVNGRNVSTLPTNAQTNAATIGITTTLDNAQDRFVQSGTAIGTTGGSNTQTLSITQIPAYSISGTTASGGDHSHTFLDLWYHSTGYTSGNTATLGTLNFTQQTITQTTNAATSTWAHSHTVTASSGGSAQAFSIEPQYLTTNLFIYLGQ